MTEYPPIPPAVIGKAELALVDCIRTSVDRATFRELAEAALNGSGLMDENDRLQAALQEIVTWVEAPSSKMRAQLNQIGRIARNAL